MTLTELYPRAIWISLYFWFISSRVNFVKSLVERPLEICDSGIDKLLKPNIEGQIEKEAPNNTNCNPNKGVTINLLTGPVKTESFGPQL